MDDQTLESLADMICGDGSSYPLYRKGAELTRFFERVGFSNFRHDGSTRKWWTLEALRQLTDKNLRGVVLRLANPREYKGDPELTARAISTLNDILSLEGMKVELDGVTPKILEVPPQFARKIDGDELKPLPSPDFLNLRLEPGVGEVLADRWAEVQKCMTAHAYLAATIIMGSLLEGMLLATLQRHPRAANTSAAAPKHAVTGKVKNFANWSLSEMINVAHDLGWIDLDIKKYSHGLREFRNLVHPYEQILVKARLDKDTSGISWLVVQAAANDLARQLQ